MSALASYQLPRLHSKRAAMTKSTNTASEPKKQPPVDHKKASELTVKILSRMEMCCRYADIAHMNSEIFDNKGYILAVESFLDHARDISKILKDLQRVRGILE